MSGTGNNDQRNQGSSPKVPVIPDHKLFRCIGRGSYGEVWLAQNMLGAYRAVKVLYRHAFSDARPLEREMAGIKKFEPISRSHEGFVDVLQIGQNDEEGYFYYVMELADDLERGQAIDPATYSPKTLARDPLRGTRLPLEECLRLGLSLSNALAELHRKGLVHRDIKPANIIFVNDIPKLADIGLVAGIEDARSYVGTEGFAPPEGPGGPASDVFGLGKVLYEITTGEDRLAFPHFAVECKALVSNPLFGELNEVICQACQNDREKRYGTAEEMHADLTLVLNGGSVKRLRLLERRFARFKKASIPLAAAAGVLVMGVYHFNREKKHREEIRQREIGSQTAYGLQAMEEGRLADALPPLVEAWRLDTGRREPMHRARLAMILDQCPKLLQVWTNASQITDARFSPDGTLAVLATREHRAKVMDVNSGEVLATPALGQPVLLEGACFSPDGKLVLTVSDDTSAILCDWRSGQQVLNLKHPKGLAGAGFNHKGDRFITACLDGVARVYSTNGAMVCHPLEHHTDMLSFAAFSPDDSLIVTCSRDKSAVIWDARSGTVLHSNLVHGSWVYCAAFSPDGKQLATASFDRSVRIWDVETGKLLLAPLEHADGVRTVEFSPDGRLVLTACMDSTARLWEAATGRPLPLNPLLRHSSRVLRASFHPDGHRIITGCYDGTCCLWDLAASSTTTLPAHALFSPDGSKFLIQTGAVSRASETRVCKTFPPIEMPAAAEEAAFSLNGQFLMTLHAPPGEPRPTNGRELCVWESETGKRSFRLEGFRGLLTEASLSKDGLQMVTWAGNELLVYDLGSTQSVARPLLHPGIVRITNAVFSSTGKQLLVYGGTRALVWDLATGKNRNFDQAIEVRWARFSRDGKLLVTACADTGYTECIARVWDVATGNPVGPPLAHRDGVLAAAFDPSSSRVVTASEDFTGSIWNLVNGGDPRKLQHKNQVREGCFNRSGLMVLTVSRDQTARIWEAETGEPLSPPLPHYFDLYHGVFLDDDSFLTANQFGDVWIWEILRDKHPIGDLAVFAGILAGKRPGVAGPDQRQETFYGAWRKMKAKNPQDFMTPKEKVAAWHRQQAIVNAREKNWHGAVFHYDELLRLSPDEATVRLRGEAAQGAAAPERAAPVH